MEQVPFLLLFQSSVKPSLSVFTVCLLTENIKCFTAHCKLCFNNCMKHFVTLTVNFLCEAAVVSVDVLFQQMSTFWVRLMDSYTSTCFVFSRGNKYCADFDPSR